MSTTVNSTANKVLLAQILQNHPWASANSLQFQQLITQEIALNSRSTLTGPIMKMI